MSPSNYDRLAQAFRELAQHGDPSRIEYCRVGDEESIRVAGFPSREWLARFKMLVGDAVRLVDGVAGNRPVERWLRLVLDATPADMYADARTPMVWHKGKTHHNAAVSGKGKRAALVAFEEISIPGAAEKSAWVLGQMALAASEAASEIADDYRPASAYPGKIASKLRMASSPTRKTKRVEKKVIDNVVCYKHSDVQQWYSQDLK
ncbi:MAG: hypothetical protein K8S99_12250 [Planctomycetes bacterium]|nr:hypothetical protein [Planctomycetota bacterium]